MKTKWTVLLSWLLAAAMCFTLVLPAAAEEPDKKASLTISSMEDFLEFAENCIRDVYSRDLVVELKTDLDFEGREYEAVPSFSGIFLGNRHTIKGIRLTTEGSYQGLFRYLTDTAIVKDLTVIGEILPTGSKSLAGGIAGTSAGKIRNCHFKGHAAGTESIGGIVGRNESGGVIEKCSVSGTIKGAHFVGGMAGENLGVIRDCKNLSSINTAEEDNKIDNISFDPDFLMGKESIGTATDLGGIAGTSSGLIRNSVNHGNVGYPRMGYNLGGICGSQKGYIVGCKNYGTIQGRKEIAGIAGQLEPVVEISYEEDTLQILRRQLDNTSALAGRASVNVQSGSQNLKGSINDLHGSADKAVDAIKTLLPQDGNWPDEDVRIAAHNTLSSSIGSMQNSLSNINQNAQSIVGTAAGDIQAINRSIDEIAMTLDHAAETLGGDIQDISDLDTPEDLSGKIEDCHNYGLISGDLNAGGIAGAVSWENDLDPENDFTVSGSRSFNFDSQLRAVILNCSNSASIEVSKKNAGGIAGNMSLGLVKNCLNTGFISGKNADYLGGIAGTSSGFIRNSNAKCKITGHSYLGGIAGSATIVSDCRSTAMVENGAQNLGSILGIQGNDLTESEDPIRGNYYLPLSDHLGAIDGIDYYGQADSLSKADFLSLPDLSSIFFRATMTFRYPDGSTQKVTVPMGEIVPEDKIPAPPRKEGYIGKWDLLDDLDLDHMYFNVTLNPEYIPTNTVVESTIKSDDGKPVLLAEGIFGEQETIEIEKSQSLPDKKGCKSAWLLPDFGSDENTVIHLIIPSYMDAQDARALVQRENGSWEEVSSQEDGSYLIFEVGPSDLAVSVYESHTEKLTEILTLACTVIAVLILAAVIIQKRKKRKKAVKKS